MFSSIYSKNNSFKVGYSSIKLKEYLCLLEFLKIMSSFYDDFKKLEDMHAQNRNFLIDELQSVAGQFEDSEVI